jgi:hypothetical protein
MPPAPISTGTSWSPATKTAAVPGAPPSGPGRQPRRSAAVLVALSLAGGLAGVTGSPAFAAVTPNVKEVPAATAPMAAAGCHLPVVTDAYDGFRVGVPGGWDVSSLQGLIGVSATAGGTEGALLYPALLTRGVSARSLLSSFVSYEQHTLAKEGETLTYSARPGAGSAGTFTLRAGGNVLSGRATVLVLPQRTAVTSQVGVAFLYWAPAAQLASAAPTLAEIGNCYQPERAALFQVFQNVGPFTFAMPAGWRVSDLNQNYIQLSGFGTGAGVDYELWGPFEQGVNATQPITSAGSAINYMFNLYGIKVTQVQAAYVLPDQPQPSGGFEATEYMEFAGTLNGKATHGFVNMEASIDGGSASGVIRLGLASPALWNSVNGGLLQMMGSIQHNFSGDLQQIAQVNRQWQDFSGQVSDFDDVLNSQQLVQDPTDGRLYEAPYSSWDPDGQNGPGYYLPSGQLLNPVQRP